MFDLEIALLLPTPWATQLPNPLTTTLWVTLIIIILTAGFIYEWLQAGLEWAEWGASPNKTPGFDPDNYGLNP